MATLREIRNKLKSVENIKKITQAMEMVAASRFRRSQEKTEQARPYMDELRKILNNLLLSSSELAHPLLKPKEKKDKIGLVVIAGDRGLCGSYNNNIFTAADRFLKNHPPENVELILIGQKAATHFLQKKWKIRQSIIDGVGKMSFDRVKTLADDLIRYFLFEGLDEIWLLYTHFQTVMKRKTVLERLLNIEITQPEAGAASPNYTFEPNEQDIFSGIIPLYCTAKVQLVLNEAFTSELAARILAMRSATKNAEELIETLTLVRNKVRQTSITRELIEITSGGDQ